MSFFAYLFNQNFGPPDPDIQTFAETYVNNSRVTSYTAPLVLLDETEAKLFMAERIGTSGSLVRVFDVRDPSTPVEVSSFTPSGANDDNSVVGYDPVKKRFYSGDTIADDWYAQSLFGSPPITSTLLYTGAFSSNMRSSQTLVFDNGDTVVHCGNGFMYVRDTTNYSVVLSSVGMPDTNYWLSKVDENTITVYNGANTFWVIDITNRAAASVVYTGAITNHAAGTLGSGTVGGLWFCKNTGFGLLGRNSMVSNTELNEFVVPMTANFSVAVSDQGGATTLLLFNSIEACIVDVTDPTTPEVSNVVTFSTTMPNAYPAINDTMGVAVISSSTGAASGPSPWTVLTWEAGYAPVLPPLPVPFLSESDFLTDLYFDAADGIAATSENVYVSAYNSNRVSVVNVDDPTNISVEGVITNITNIRGIDALPGLDFVFGASSNNADFWSIDVSNKAAPGPAVNINVPEYCYFTKVKNSTWAFVLSDVTQQITSVNISTPSAPTIGQSADFFSDYPRGIDFIGDVAFVAARDSRIVAIDTTNPTAMSSISVKVDGTYLAQGVDVYAHPNRDLIYVRGGAEYFTIMDVSDPSNMQITQSEKLGGTLQGALILSDTEILAMVGNNIHRIDVTDPANMLVMNTYYNTQGTSLDGGLKRVANHLYALSPGVSGLVAWELLI